MKSKIQKTVRSTPAVERELSQEPGQSGGRPRREKPVTPMSEIERAKIKNLNSDLKFKVNKHSKTEVYIIEYLKEKKGNSFLVKWENRHETENSWEVRRKIPASVLQVNLNLLTSNVFLTMFSLSVLRGGLETSWDSRAAASASHKVTKCEGEEVRSVTGH